MLRDALLGSVGSSLVAGIGHRGCVRVCGVLLEAQGALVLFGVALVAGGVGTGDAESRLVLILPCFLVLELDGVVGRGTRTVVISVVLRVGGVNVLFLFSTGVQVHALDVYGTMRVLAVDEFVGWILIVIGSSALV